MNADSLIIPMQFVKSSPRRSRNRLRDSVQSSRSSSPLRRKSQSPSQSYSTSPKSQARRFNLIVDHPEPKTTDYSGLHIQGKGIQDSQGSEVMAGVRSSRTRSRTLSPSSSPKACPKQRHLSPSRRRSLSPKRAATAPADDVVSVLLARGIKLKEAMIVSTLETPRTDVSSTLSENVTDRLPSLSALHRYAGV